MLLSTEIRTPRNPIELLPAMANPGEVRVYYVDLGQFDSTAFALGQEREYQGRIDVGRAPIR